MKIIKNKLYNCYFAACVVIAFNISCNQEVELNLPTYESKMVLEFYLEDNKPLRCLLQESTPFTDNKLFKLIDGATIVLSYKSQKDTLLNQAHSEIQFEKVFNYYNPRILRLEPNVIYDVYVKDRLGREMTGKTQFTEATPIDSLVYKYNNKQKASAGLIFSDPSNTTDYYRLLAFKNAPIVKDTAVWDITFDDLTFNGKKFSFFTGNSFVKGDTVIGRLYRLTTEHQVFIQSVSSSQASNQNPFGQPAAIRTNLTGGLGVFTTISFDEKKIIIK